MLAARLVNLVEAHSNRLSDELLQKFLATDRCSSLRSVPPDELRERSYEIYRNLSSWLLTKTDKGIEVRYREIGATRAAQGVTLSHLVYALTMTKEHLLEYLDRESFYDSSLALYGHLEFMRILNQFFDRAIYYAVMGYERATASKVQAA
jgi:hypothetical protein